MEALSRQAPKSPQQFTLIFSKQAVGIVLNNGNGAAGGACQDGIHLAADPGVMDGQNGAGAGGDGAFQQAFVQVQGIGADIYKYRAGAADDKGINGGSERE